MQPAAFEEVDPPGDPLQPEILYARLSAGDSLTIVDIRNKQEFGEWHISGPNVSVVNIPAYDFIDDENDQVLERVPEADELIIVCAEGKSSALIAGWLVENGYNARNLADGMEGWARVYVSSEITAYSGPGTLYQYLRPSSGCLSYMVVSGDEAAVIDPLSAFADRYLEDAEEMSATLEYALDTHIHADHISGVRRLGERGVNAMVPMKALERGATYRDEVTGIEDGESVEVGSVTVEAVHAPGHTTGMTAYLVDDQVLLTGDGLFTDSVARPDLEEGDEGAPAAARQLHRSIHERILSLSPDTIIAGGHTSESAAPGEDGTFTARLGDLQERMTLLGMEESDFVERVLSDMPPRPANYQRIIATNLGRETPDEETAFELELGPNNCATSAEALE